ncbi:MAG: type II toxin-antitoxin system RelE/ParE family toxin [Erythrobacter sp.]
MMLIRFRSSAKSDLSSLLAYLEEHAPSSKQAVVDDLSRSLETISSFPSAGAQVDGRHYKRIITPRYHFKLVYEVAAEQINVLAILRQQGRAY